MTRRNASDAPPNAVVPSTASSVAVRTASTGLTIAETIRHEKQKSHQMGRRRGCGGRSLAGAQCSSAEKKAMIRSSELVESLKQRSIPGLPASLTPAQAVEIERARTGPGGWFVETGCFGCHSVSVYGVKSYSQVGPDLSNAVEDVRSRFGKNIDEFWREPVGTMMMVRSQVLKLTPEQEAVGLEKLKAAFAEYERQKQTKHADEHK